jgi:hypothetical protein
VPESNRHQNEASASAHWPLGRDARECKNRDGFRGANRMVNAVAVATTADERRTSMKSGERMGCSRGPRGGRRSN